MLGIYNKLGYVVVTLTISIMFYALEFGSSILEHTQLSDYTLLKLLLSLGLSLATFKLISLGVDLLAQKARWLRKLLLGEHYLEGTWIGFFRHSGSYHITIEFIDQKSGSIQIEGLEYTDLNLVHANWSSYIADFDAKKKSLTYAYKCSVRPQKSEQSGVAFFSVQRLKGSKYPNFMDGYSADLVDGEKDGNTEYKVSDDFLEPSEAIVIAKERFKNEIIAIENE